jgi:hypothetical protein
MVSIILSEASRAEFAKLRNPCPGFLSNVWVGQLMMLHDAMMQWWCTCVGAPRSAEIYTVLDSVSSAARLGSRGIMSTSGPFPKSDKRSTKGRVSNCSALELDTLPLVILST